MQWIIEILQQFTNLRLDFLVSMKAQDVNSKKKKREQGSVGIDPKVFIPELVDHCYKMIWTVWFRHASSNLAIVELL